jgi:hypothetical protein
VDDALALMRKATEDNRRTLTGRRTQNEKTFVVTKIGVTKLTK